MRICKLICCNALSCILLAATPFGVAAREFEDFILFRNGTEEKLIQLKSHKENIDDCFTTKSHLICVKSRNIPNSHNNPTVQNASIKILLHQIKKNIYMYSLKSINNLQLNNKPVAIDTYINLINANNKKFSLVGIESSNVVDEDLILAFASVQYKKFIKEIEESIHSKEFINEYCINQFIIAKKLYESGNYNNSLTILKELHDLKWANAEAYILASDVFLKTGNPADALKIAKEVLSDLSSQLSSELAENLGDIFLELGKDIEAEHAFNLALSAE